LDSEEQASNYILDGSDYERSQDFSTTVKKARAEYHKGICPVPETHAVATYLKSRKLWPLSEWESNLLKAQFYVAEEFDGFWMAAPLHDENGSLVAVQRTSISKQGEKVRVGDANDRITIGEAYSASIRLVPVADKVLHIAEGLEDALSVARLFPGAICWATCGRRGMEEVAVPTIVEEVRICADNDPAGIESAQVLAMRMVLQGKAVRIFMSKMPGEDPNDALVLGHDMDEPLSGWLARITTFKQWQSLSEGERENRLKSLAKAEGLTIGAIKAEWKNFINASRPRRALLKGGIADSIDKAVVAGYRYNRQGIMPNDVINAHIALRRIGLTARLDLFDMALWLTPAKAGALISTVPGSPLHGLGMGDSGLLQDALLPPLITFIALKDGVTFSDTMLLSALRALGHANRHHSLQDWLAGHPAWDETPRVGLVLHNVFGVEDTPLTRWGSAALFVGQALRILQPGAKVDVMPVLVGESGLRKSTFVKDIAAGGPEKFTDAHLDVENSRQVLEQTLGKTVVEWPEMASATKADWESLKAFLSKTTDSGRLAYGKSNTEMPRGYINVGTVNDMQFIRSEIGSRRFLPLEVKRLGDFSFVKDHWGQLWAEARLIAASLPGELAVPPALWDTMAGLRAQHTRRNPFAYLMEPFLEAFPDAVLRSSDIKKFLLGHNQRTVSDNELGEAMKELGFQRQANAFEFGKDRWRGWWRGEKPTSSDVDRRLLRLRRNDSIGRPEFASAMVTMDDVNKVSAASAATTRPPAGGLVIRRSRGASKPKPPYIRPLPPYYPHYLSLNKWSLNKYRPGEYRRTIA
jgi:hypothetical protein